MTNEGRRATANNADLEQKIDELRAELGEALGDLREAGKTTVDIAELRAEVASVQEVLDEVRAVLLGNGDGLVVVVDKLADSLEHMGRLYEETHRTIQLLNDVISRLVDKLAIEKVARDVADLSQSIMVAHHVARTG
ncbi:MAG: hypothetical protein GY832_26240 [Chloroflexi bacterium]|nr:hypothetical protein [Chloroflexota bacterium]